MRNYNKVILVGTLGVTPELRKTKSGVSVTNFSVSTMNFWKDRNGQLQRQRKWHRIVCWGKLAETVTAGLKRGMLVLVEGSISYRTNKQSAKTIAEIKATDVKKWANARINNKGEDDENNKGNN